MATSPPNLLFLFPDQLGARYLPTYGHRLVRTPSLDALAARSHVFDRCLSVSPLCTPYRCALLSGKHPTETGVRQNGQAMPEGQLTLAHRLDEADYHTAWLGKWHLSGEPGANRWVPPNQRGGFQTFIGWESHHVDHWKGLIWAEDPYRPVTLPGHETDGLASIVQTQIAECAVDDVPWAMFVSFQSPHPPCTPPLEFYERYKAADVFTEPTVDREAWYDMPQWNANYAVDEFRRRYFGEIEQLDAAIGRILGTLQDEGLMENTIVVFTSDHGEMAGCHGLFSKGVAYDEALRVPLMISMPGQVEQRRVPAAIGTLDLSRTLLELCDAQALPHAHGRSFAGLLRGEGDAPVGPVFSEYEWLSVVEGGWKLVVDRDTLEPTQLFHVDEDVYEEHDLVNDDAATAERDRLRGMVREWWEGLAR